MVMENASGRYCYKGWMYLCICYGRLPNWSKSFGKVVEPTSDLSIYI